MSLPRNRALDAAQRKDRVGHLANVLRTARVDGQLSPDELQVFDEIAAGLSAGASEIAEARQVAASDQAPPHYAWTPDAQLANFDDMLMMAMADGRFATEEKAWLEEQGAVLSLSQEEVNQAIQRATRRLARIREQVQARQKAVEPSDLPPGRPAAAGTPPSVPLVRPEGGSRVARPASAVRGSPRATPFGHAERVRPSGESAPLARRAAPPPHRSERLRGPWEARVDPAASAPPPEAVIASDPTSAPVPVPDPDPVPEAVAVAPGTVAEEGGTLLARCVFARGQAEDGEAYCHGLGSEAANPWGCRLAGMPWVPGAKWLSCGGFRDTRTFVFDKGEIARLLEDRLGVAMACPHLDLARAARALSVMPAHAVPGLLWAWRDAAPGEVGVAFTVRSHVQGCAIHQTRRVAAPDPVGDRLLRRILRDSAVPSKGNGVGP